MFRDHVRRMMRWLRRAVTSPREELNRWQRTARFAFDLGRYGARQLREDRAPQMAAALAFRTLFGLAPVLVVATVLMKSIRGADVLLASFRQLLDAAGLDEIHVMPIADNGGAATGAGMTLAAWLEDLTGQLANMNLSAIGWVGFAVIVYAAIGLMVTIENSFNIVYRAPGGRPWTRRVPLYWFILTVSPALLALGSYVNGQFTEWIASVHAWQWLLTMARALWSFGLAWLFMFAVYTLVPNSSVRLQPALIGAFVATLLLAVGKHTLGAYLGNAFTINQLYGSLGLVPLFMFWVYLMWLAVLFGLQVSATLQALHGRSLEEMHQRQRRTGLVEPSVVVRLMEVVAQNFNNGRAMAIRAIADECSIPESTVSLIVERLVKDEFLHRVEGPDSSVTLTRPPDQISASSLMEIGFELIDEASEHRSSAFAQRLRDAQQAVADGITLAALLPESSAVAG